MRSNRPRPRRGVTLIELIVVLAILGIMAGVVGLTMRAAPAPPPQDTFVSRIAALRDSALSSGHPVTMIVERDSVFSLATAYPDGRVMTESDDIDHMTGRPRPHVAP